VLLTWLTLPSAVFPSFSLSFYFWLKEAPLEMFHEILCEVPDAGRGIMFTLWCTAIVVVGANRCFCDLTAQFGLATTAGVVAARPREHNTTCKSGAPLLMWAAATVSASWFHRACRLVLLLSSVSTSRTCKPAKFNDVNLNKVNKAPYDSGLLDHTSIVLR